MLLHGSALTCASRGVLLVDDTTLPAKARTQLQEVGMGVGLRGACLD